jgi:hypothetical protein
MTEPSSLNDGWTPVFTAAKNGHTETVRALVQEYAAEASTADNKGWTPVFIAAQNETEWTQRDAAGAGAGVRRRRQHCQQR